MVGILATAYFGYLAKRNEQVRLNHVENEVELHRFALSFDDFFREWQSIENDLKSLLEETCIDRFLVLRAFNGQEKPKWTNAIFQMRSDPKYFVDYKFVELDQDYIERLGTIVNSNKLKFTVDQIPESLTKSIYVAEDIKHSAWFHIASYDTQEGTRMITYCSFATIGDDPIDKQTEIKCQLIANRFKRIADSLMPHEHA